MTFDVYEDRYRIFLGDDNNVERLYGAFEDPNLGLNQFLRFSGVMIRLLIPQNNVRNVTTNNPVLELVEQYSAYYAISDVKIPAR